MSESLIDAAQPTPVRWWPAHWMSVFGLVNWKLLVCTVVGLWLLAGDLWLTGCGLVAACCCLLACLFTCTIFFNLNCCLLAYCELWTIVFCLLACCCIWLPLLHRAHCFKWLHIDVPVLCYRFPIVIETFPFEIFRSRYPVIPVSFSRPTFPFPFPFPAKKYRSGNG